MTQAQIAVLIQDTRGYRLFSVLGNGLVRMTYSDGSFLEKNMRTGVIFVGA